MSFKIEKMFGMISVAVLGLLAISCVPNVKEMPAKDVVIERPIDLEVDAVRQVELMNAQPRPVFQAGFAESDSTQN